VGVARKGRAGKIEKEDPMSDDTQRPAEHEEPADEVEGHRHHKAGLTDEGANDEAESDDEVEAHRHHKTA
jgi:hypothetical protein